MHTRHTSRMRILLGLPMLLSAFFFLSFTYQAFASEPLQHTPWGLPWSRSQSVDSHHWPGPGSPTAPAATSRSPVVSSSSPSNCGYAGGGPTATIDAGVLIGTSTAIPSAIAPVNKFLGIPFAKSPPERFSPPEKPASWSEPLNVKAWSPACIQQFVYPPEVQYFTKLIFNDPGAPAPEESEDCLYLNVYAPSTPAPSDGRSVLFWIYGGGFNFGNAGQPAYDGSFLAAYEDVIVVTINYRTNVFGFAPSPELPLDQRNLGFLDQRLCLDWVQRNIAAFGGSPDKVTIFGESAGGFSVDALLTTYTPDLKPPFRGAIMESGQYSFHYSPLLDSADSWYNLSAALNCPGSYSSNLTCLRAANATEIKSIIETSILAFNPTYDNVTLASDAAQRRIDGNVAHVPSLGGNNAQEGRVFEVGQTNTTLALTGMFGDNPDLISTIEQAYALNSPGIGGTPYDQLSKVVTEVVFQCPQALWSNLTAANGIPSWRYYFNASFYNLQPFPALGVYHSSEIPLVFGTYFQDNATTQEVALSNSMMSMWARFAKNPAGGPGWNRIGTGQASTVLAGAYLDQPGGLYVNTTGEVLSGGWDLGVLGNRGDALGSGVTIIDESEVDFRCGIFKSLYETINDVSIP